MAFADADDIAIRLRRDLTQEEVEAAEQLLDGVTAEIVEAVDLDEEQIVYGVDVLKAISIEAVCRELASPIGASMTSETVGAYRYTVQHRETGGTFLTEAEELRVRRAVHGQNAASTSPESMIDRVVDLREGRAPDEDPE